MRTDEVMKTYQVSRQTIHNRIRAGRLTVKKDWKGRNCFMREELEREFHGGHDLATEILAKLKFLEN